MAKRIDKFQCECCYTIFDIESSAVACEQTHCKPKHIEDYDYGIRERYPERISIIMDDDTVRLYCLL